MDDKKRATEELIGEVGVIQHKQEKSSKRSYLKPEMITEELMAFGAVCNGSTNGQRKDSTGAPNFCNAGRLLS